MALLLADCTSVPLNDAFSPMPGAQCTTAQNVFPTVTVGPVRVRFVPPETLQTADTTPELTSTRGQDHDPAASLSIAV